MLLNAFYSSHTHLFLVANVSETVARSSPVWCCVRSIRLARGLASFNDLAVVMMLTEYMPCEIDGTVNLNAAGALNWKKATWTFGERRFSQQTILTCHTVVRKAQVLLITSTMALF